MGGLEAGEDKPSPAARRQPESEAARQPPGLPGLESEPQASVQPSSPFRLSVLFPSWSCYDLPLHHNYEGKRAGSGQPPHSSLSFTPL